MGAAKPRSNGGLVLNLRDGVAIVEPSGERRWLVYWEREGVRGNDAGVDAMGRLWAGTMRYDTAPGGGWLAGSNPTARRRWCWRRRRSATGWGGARTTP
ncbi:hypothetical protein GCM10029964_014000 [Kibdelosporangium lantanae]